MRILMIAIMGVAMFACAAQPEPIGSTEQEACSDDQDTCPGGHLYTLRQQAIDAARDLANRHSIGLMYGKRQYLHGSYLSDRFAVYLDGMQLQHG